MTAESAWRIGRACTDADIQQWRAGIGRFVEKVHSTVAAEVREVCNVCPLRNNIMAGGCCGEGCPVHQVGYTKNRACSRATTAVKEIYRQKFKRTA